MATFATYSLTGNNLTSQIAFVSLSLFNILRFPLSMLPMLISNMVEAFVSLQRVTKFLKNEELDPEASVREQRPYAGGGGGGDEEELIDIETASFYWSKDERVILKE